MPTLLSASVCVCVCLCVCACVSVCLCSTSLSKEPVTVQLPVRTREDKREVVPWPVLDVHSVVAYLWNDIGLRVPQDAIKEFWHHSRQFGQPWAIEHEASDAHCPLGLYGDSAKICTAFDSDKVVGVFLNLPLWRPKSIRFSRFLLFSIEESKLDGPHTLNCIFNRISWSVNLLFSGRRPQVDPQGRPFTDSHLFDGWVCRNRQLFALTEIRGDQLWHKQTFRYLASWVWTSARVCHACDARAHGPGSADRLYFRFQDWLPTEFTRVEFLARRMPQQNICYFSRYGACVFAMTLGSCCACSPC